MKAFSIALKVLGTVILAISITHVLIGPAWMPEVGAINANIDSQHRFYTAMFGFFGVALWWASKNLPTRLPIVKMTAVMFLVGGGARVLSILMTGLPHWFYLVLLAVEFIAPAVILIWASQLFGTSKPHPPA